MQAAPNVLLSDLFLLSFSCLALLSHNGICIACLARCKEPCRLISSERYIAVSGPDVLYIADKQCEYAEKWHNDPELWHNLTGLDGMIIDQMRFNYRLWHEEDEARRTDVDDEVIAQVKRNIDSLNQMRNDAIELVDEYIISDLVKNAVSPSQNATLSTETPGSAFDRLSIAALRIFHLRQELVRDDVDDAHLDKVRQRLQRALEQREDLKKALSLLMDEIYSGSKLLKIYRQFKMYNDPDLNPAVYETRR